MQNQYLGFGKAVLFPRDQAICLKNWKLWRAPTTVVFDIFCWRFSHVFCLPMSTKGCSGFFILFRSWVIDKHNFCEFVETRSSFILANNSSSKQNKNFEHPFLDIVKLEAWARFRRKSLNSTVVETRQSS